MTKDPVSQRPPAGRDGVLSSRRITAVRSLARRAVRERHGLFLVEGPHAVEAALRHRPGCIRDLYVDREGAHEDWHRSLTALAETAGIPALPVARRDIAAMSDATTAQGVLAVCRRSPSGLEVVPDDAVYLVVLSEIRDPGNAGTVIRGADAFGADAVIVCSGSVDVYAPKVVRSSAGSVFHLPIVTGVTFSDAVAALRARGMCLIATDPHAPATGDDLDLGVPHAWVFGNEARGLSPEDAAACDTRLRIQTPGRAESLNLAMAATVCLYQSARAVAVAANRASRHRPGLDRPGVVGVVGPGL